ncbi:ATP-dependent helicase [Patescibacteria group bacterium]
MEKNLIKDLNESQRKAVIHKDGPLLVIAGAGAGKTRVITHRIAYLISKGVNPRNILAVTFTNKAASEMKNRIKKLLGYELQITNYKLLPVVGTFHSVCAQILRENANKAGLAKNYNILDKEDTLKIIKKCLKELDLDPKQFQPLKMLSIISRQKSRLIKPSVYAQEARGDYFPETLLSIWNEYERHLKNQKSVDFDDLISKVVYLFEDCPEILEKYQNKWTYILVDEYQDTNHAQYTLTKLLASKNKNICVVGDEDQSIYRFRGADFGNILNFEKDWQDTKVIMLEQNYRSTQNILKAANSVIGNNKMRKPKNLFSCLDKGNSLALIDTSSEKEEAYFVAIKSASLIASGIRHADIAVLYRANFQSRILEEAFLSRNIPYQVVGTKFYHRKEIKDILAYIKLAFNPEDILSLERVISEPPRGIGKASLVKYLSGRECTPSRVKKIKDFFLLMDNLNKILTKEKLSTAILKLAKKCGYWNHLNDKTEEGQMRLGNIKELVTLSTKYDNLENGLGAHKLLEDVALMSEQDALDKPIRQTQGKQSKNVLDNKVRLMTVHAAKGLEFSHVFLVGLEDGLFPYMNFTKKDEEEEERRLFYVAMTRAKEQLFLSFAYYRNFFGQKQINKPSRFISEIPEELFSTDNEFTPDDELFEQAETNYLEM